MTSGRYKLIDAVRQGVRLDKSTRLQLKKTCILRYKCIQPVIIPTGLWNLSTYFESTVQINQN